GAVGGLDDQHVVGVGHGDRVAQRVGGDPGLGGGRSGLAHRATSVAGESVGAAASSTAAARNMGTSPSDGARTCTPTGSPSVPVPKGTDMAGWPARLVGIVQMSLRYMVSGSWMASRANAVVGEVGDSSTSKRS